ncbi:MAG: hypothetical protein JXB49_17345 [Bacteroidales bacterium]|nr:hypothetical protein [Bacteroidales bacterium]
MKKINLAFIAFTLLFLTVNCDKDLPYPIDEVKRGVVIDITRVAGTDGLLSDGITTGNYKVNLTIPEQQGDYSFMKHAQLLAVMQGVDGEFKSQLVIDNITEFPKEIVVDIADIYSKFGLTAPSLGETVYLTTNTVLQDGTIIAGWDEVVGFNNKAFSGWQVDGRAYSYNVRYAVACLLDQDPVSGTFIGAFICDESSGYGDDSYSVTLTNNPNPPADEFIPIGVSADELYGINITPISPNVWIPAIKTITVWINVVDHSLLVPDQDTGDLYNGVKILWSNISDASVSVCNQTIEFTSKPTIPGIGSYSGISFKIHL